MWTAREAQQAQAAPEDTGNGVGSFLGGKQTGIGEMFGVLAQAVLDAPDDLRVVRIMKQQESLIRKVWQNSLNIADHSCGGVVTVDEGEIEFPTHRLRSLEKNLRGRTWKQASPVRDQAPVLRLDLGVRIPRRPAGLRRDRRAPQR